MAELSDFAETVIDPTQFTAGSDATSLAGMDFGFTPQPSSGLSDFASSLAAAPGKAWDWLTSGGGGGGKGGGPAQPSPLSSFAQLLGLGATGMNIGSQISTGRQTAQAAKGVQRAQKAAETAAAPAVAFGTETLQAAQQGKLPAPMQAAVQQWTQQAKAAIRQRYASMGLTNSSDIAREEQNIDLMAQSMIAQLLQGQEGTALQGLQTGVSAATGGGQLAAEQQQMLTNLIANANAQLGQLAAKG